MKIKPDDYSTMLYFLRCAANKCGEDAESEYREAGLTPMRFRWDLLYLSKLRIGNGVGTEGDVNIYAYADDTHIDTALRKIMREIGFDWAATN